MLIRRLATLAGLAVVGTTLTACGGGDPATLAGAEDAVEDYLDAIEDGDWDDACEALTKDGRQALIDEWNAGMDSDDQADTCEEAMKSGWMLYSMFSGGKDLDLDVDRFDSEETGEGEASVKVTYEDASNGTETYRLVYVDDEWLIDYHGDESAEDHGETEEEGNTEEEETPEPAETTTAPPTPTVMGLPAPVGDWVVTITDLNTDATKAIKKANEFNDPARHRYVLVTFTATYNGSERTADTSGDLTWTLTGTDQTVLHEADAVTPFSSEDRSTTVRTGGTVEGQIVFDVDPAVLTGALLSVESYGDDFESEYVDFQLP